MKYIVRDGDLELRCVQNGADVQGEYVVAGEVLFTDNLKTPGKEFIAWMISRSDSEQMKWISMLIEVMNQVHNERMSEIIKDAGIV